MAEMIQPGQMNLIAVPSQAVQTKPIQPRRPAKRQNPFRTVSVPSTMILPHTEQAAGPSRMSMATAAPRRKARVNRKFIYPDETGIDIASPDQPGVRLSRRGAPVRFNRANQNVVNNTIEYINRYKNLFGLAPYRHTERMKIDEDLSKRTADAFDLAPHSPQDPKVLVHYNQLAKELIAQYKHMISKGVSVEPWLNKGQPYSGSNDMFNDVAQRNHLWFFPTINPHEKSFGDTQGDNDPINNPLLKQSGIKLGNGFDMTLNDILRVVHDYYAHAGGGFEFGPEGELNAWAEHTKMLSPVAAKALTAETHGQNSWVNFGKHIRRPDGSIPRRKDPDYKPQHERPFAEQKTTILPESVTPPHPYSQQPEKTMLMARSPARTGIVVGGIQYPPGQILPAEATQTQPKRNSATKRSRLIVALRKCKNKC